MNRSEAFAPLSEGEARLSFEAGAWLCGPIRRSMIKLMLDFYEDKGILDSAFIARGPVDRMYILEDYLRNLSQNG